MNRTKLKLYIIIFSNIFVFLSYVTWQQITMFRMGYKITRLKEDIRNEEMKRQRIMKLFQTKNSLEVIEKKARQNFKMLLPGYPKYGVLEVDIEKMLYKKNKNIRSFLVQFKKVFSTSDAQAK